MIARALSLALLLTCCNNTVTGPTVHAASKYASIVNDPSATDPSPAV